MFNHAERLRINLSLVNTNRINLRVSRPVSGSDSGYSAGRRRYIEKHRIFYLEGMICRTTPTNSECPAVWRDDRKPKPKAEKQQQTIVMDGYRSPCLFVVPSTVQMYTSAYNSKAAPFGFDGIGRIIAGRPIVRRSMNEGAFEKYSFIPLRTAATYYHRTSSFRRTTVRRIVWSFEKKKSFHE